MATGTPASIQKKTPKNPHKNAHKSSKNFKPSIHNVVSIETNLAK